MEFKIKIEKMKDRQLYVATSPDLRGLVVEGETVEDVKANFVEALQGFIESYNQHFEQLPVRGNEHSR